MRTPTVITIHTRTTLSIYLSIRAGIITSIRQVLLPQSSIFLAFLADYSQTPSHFLDTFDAWDNWAANNSYTEQNLTVLLGEYRSVRA